MEPRALLGSFVSALRRRALAPEPRRQDTRPVACAAEALEGRVMFALAESIGGSGYSGTLSSDPSTRRQQLIADPIAPVRGSTSVTYKPDLVHLSGVQKGPGYNNSYFCAFVEVKPWGATKTVLQPLSDFLSNPCGKETGYAQVRYKLQGEPGQLYPPPNFKIKDEDGVSGVDTHAFLFDLKPGVPLEAVAQYTIFAAPANTHGNNPEDFLVTSTGLRLGPGQLKSATVAGNTLGDPPKCKAELRADPSFKNQKALFVTGTSGNDEILFKKVAGGLQVIANKMDCGTFKGFKRVIAFGLAGNDTIKMLSPAAENVLFFGGAGNDTLSTGNGWGILAGGSGLDTLTGGNGRDLLIGGKDNLVDKLFGGNGKNVLEQDGTTYDGLPSSGDIQALTNRLK